MTVLQESITRLEVRVARLEETLQNLVNTSSGDTKEVFVAQPTHLTQAQLIDWLKNRGVIRTPTQEEEQLAAEWHELPEQEKQEHIDFMQHLELEPPLSQIILENRR